MYTVTETHAQLTDEVPLDTVYTAPSSGVLRSVATLTGPPVCCANTSFPSPPSPPCNTQDKYGHCVRSTTGATPFVDHKPHRGRGASGRAHRNGPHRVATGITQNEHKWRRGWLQVVIEVGPGTALYYKRIETGQQERETPSCMELGQRDAMTVHTHKLMRRK